MFLVIFEGIAFRKHVGTIQSNTKTQKKNLAGTVSIHLYPHLFVAMIT